MVALKKVRMEREKEGFPITAIREIKILQSLRHENVVRLLEVVSSTKNFYMVFEYMSNDLTGLLDSGQSLKLRPEDVKCVVYQILSGLNYMHKQNVLHRDLKPSNILLNARGQVKLADFGLSRPYQGPSRYTNRVVTLWYRSPELLLGATEYDWCIDVWAVGCILGELLLNRALLPGSTEPQQIELIWELCGTPLENGWPDARDLPFAPQLFPKYKRRNVVVERLRRYEDQSRARYCSEHALALLNQMLSINPARRVLASSAMDAPYFHEGSRMSTPEELPAFAPCYEWTKKAEREKERERKEAERKRKRK
eukprot:TRINITY_DN18402_c0_g1_i1.p2 TRINITY_DN18402_c0_g1~~TRINITY_DN18402_c0_g1_i1.p2  ORF type:complete len:311 (+),score=-51.36 TRINITY_DN18402_c0_g1_i1:57-989(+)